MANQFTVTVNPKTDVLDIQKGKLMTSLKGYDVEPGMAYQVSLESNAMYHSGTLPVNKIVVYNTTNNNSKGWFYVIEQGSPTIIKIGSQGTDHNKVYVFFIDITSQDNTGSAKVTFTPVC